MRIEILINFYDHLEISVLSSRFSPLHTNKKTTILKSSIVVSIYKKVET